MAEPRATPTDVVTRLIDRTNAHDLDGVVACFGQGYTLTNPAHPSRDLPCPRKKSHETG